MNPKITLEQIYENYKYKIAALKREREELVATKCMSLEKIGLLVRIESDIEFYEMLNEAVGKQIAKKPIEFDDCPECGYCLMWHEKDWVNCPGCGQKIDWGKE